MRLFFVLVQENFIYIVGMTFFMIFYGIEFIHLPIFYYYINDRWYLIRDDLLFAHMYTFYLLM